MTQNHSDRMRRLAVSDLLPERAGQPVKAWVHITLADLMMIDGSSALLEQWTSQVRAQWAAHRAAASEGRSDGGAWLDGDAVGPDGDPAGSDDGGHGDASTSDGDGNDHVAGPGTFRAWEAIERAIIGKAVDLLSGPGGLAAFLRRRQLRARLAGPSLPLDIGYSTTIPAGIRNAVILRDRRCRWPGGCDQPAAACDVHHVKHKANGGPTSTRNCVLLCFYHHQVVIHRQGWTLVLNPDGTTTAWNKDKTKVLHSHGPPARPG
jgi:HNH endonuclease